MASCISTGFRQILLRCVHMRNWCTKAVKIPDISSIPGGWKYGHRRTLYMHMNVLIITSLLIIPVHCMYTSRYSWSRMTTCLHSSLLIPESIDENLLRVFLTLQGFNISGPSGSKYRAEYYKTIRKGYWWFISRKT